MKELNIVFVGIDNWDRPVYKDKKGNYYKDVNLGIGELALCTSSNNRFDGEPDSYVDSNININILEKFNQKEDKER